MSGRTRLTRSVDAAPLVHCPRSFRYTQPFQLLAKPTLRLRFRLVRARIIVIYVFRVHSLFDQGQSTRASLIPLGLKN
jgi:hypothetical protein